MNEAYRMGFKDGYAAALDVMNSPSPTLEQLELKDLEFKRAGIRKTTKRKARRSPKAKLLDKMTKPIWNKYKKGSGKKTYVQIRAQVSRSQKYKRAVKRL